MGNPRSPSLRFQSCSTILFISWAAQFLYRYSVAVLDYVICLFKFACAVNLNLAMGNLEEYLSWSLVLKKLAEKSALFPYCIFAFLFCCCFISYIVQLTS